MLIHSESNPTSRHAQSVVSAKPQVVPSGVKTRSTACLRPQVGDREEPKSADAACGDVAVDCVAPPSHSFMGSLDRDPESD